MRRSPRKPLIFKGIPPTLGPLPGPPRAARKPQGNRSKAVFTSLTVKREHPLQELAALFPRRFGRVVVMAKADERAGPEAILPRGGDVHSQMRGDPPGLLILMADKVIKHGGAAATHTTLGPVEHGRAQGLPPWRHV